MQMRRHLECAFVYHLIFTRLELSEQYIAPCYWLQLAIEDVGQS